MGVEGKERKQEKTASGLWSSKLPSNCRAEITSSVQGSALLWLVGE